MVSLGPNGLNTRQSDIFKEFTYLSLTWIKPFCTFMQFAEQSKRSRKVENFLMMISTRADIYTRRHKGWEWHFLCSALLIGAARQKN